MRSRLLGLTMLVLSILAGMNGVWAADRALVIGIDRYPGIKVDGVGNARDLRGAVNDARKMAKLFSEVFAVPEKNIHLLTDESATRKAILDAISRELVGKTKAGDRVFLYYAGHGAQVGDVSGDESEDSYDEVLVPSDATAELASNEATLDGVILDDELNRLIAKLVGRQVTVIVDACHSGTITRNADRSKAGYQGIRTLTPNGPIALARSADMDLDADDVDRTSRSKGLASRGSDGKMLASPGLTRKIGPKLAVWSAVTSAQYALEDMSVGGSAGLFTSRFIRGLEGFEADLNGNGQIAPAELLDYLRVETQIYCGDFDCLDQDPLPMLEAYTGYEREAMADIARFSGDKLAQVATETGSTLLRKTDFSAVSSDLVPARGPKVTVTLLSGGEQPVGSALKLTVTSEIDGRLILLDARDNGEVVQLFPNDYSRALGMPDMIAAGETRAFPGEDAPFELSADSAGKGMITALVVDPAVDVGRLLAANGQLGVIADAGTYESDLAGAISRAIVFTATANAEGAPKIVAPKVARGDAAYQIK